MMNALLLRAGVLRTLILCVGLGLGGCGPGAAGNSVNTTAGLVAEAVETALQRHAERGGRLEQARLGELFDAEQLELWKRRDGIGLEERFQLPGAAAVVDPATQARVLAVTAYQVIENRRRPAVGRYVVWRHAQENPPKWESRIWGGWVEEARLQQLFDAAHVPLQTKGTWPQPGSATDSYGTWTGWLLVPTLAALLLWLWLTRHKGPRWYG